MIGSSLPIFWRLDAILPETMDKVSCKNDKNLNSLWDFPKCQYLGACVPLKVSRPCAAKTIPYFSKISPPSNCILSHLILPPSCLDCHFSQYYYSEMKNYQKPGSSTE